MSGLLKSFKWAIEGLKFCVRKEKNFQLHCLAAIIAIAAGFIFKISSAEWMFILICIALVLAVEMMNTAIEHLCNIIHPSVSPSVKIIKDVSAGAVFLVAVMAAVCGAIIFIPKLMAYF